MAPNIIVPQPSSCLPSFITKPPQKIQKTPRHKRNVVGLGLSFLLLLSSQQKLKIIYR